MYSKTERASTILFDFILFLCKYLKSVILSETIKTQEDIIMIKKKVLFVIPWFAMCMLFLSGFAVAGKYSASMGISIMLLALATMPACGESLEKALPTYGTI